MCVCEMRERGSRGEREKGEVREREKEEGRFMC